MNRKVILVTVSLRTLSKHKKRFFEPLIKWMMKKVLTVVKKEGVENMENCFQTFVLQIVPQIVSFIDFSLLLPHKC